jgi:hypothetical protein
MKRTAILCTLLGFATLGLVSACSHERIEKETKQTVAPTPTVVAPALPVVVAPAPPVIVQQPRTWVPGQWFQEGPDMVWRPGHWE